MTKRTLIILALFAVGLVGLAVWWNTKLPKVAEIHAMIMAEDPKVLEIRALRRGAAEGDPRDQYGLAEVYRTGDGVTAQPEAALKWYEEAARQGHLDAQYQLGHLYETGSGVNQDYNRAAEWYRLAAQLGRHREAEFRMGQLHFNGKGVAHDFNKARQWYRKAADRGHPVAQFLLGAMYEEGWGIDEDLITAYVYYRLASRDKPRLKAESDRYKIDEVLQRLEGRMSRFQKEQGDRRLAAWRPKA
ncbi:tetratricopeptide repeat protein [Magnetospira sp. QH-2]|uniref:tetratricopeptide repeat protein n=1 Tax=Magnetospira sp. (strain QH-2) TaxID=1288970 RepID=UPI0003E80D71|nr:tetratricopeptide repeat protein [Magnetospira sp. QH-2]CCQ74074.1 Conserved protein of unknown function. Containing TPR repeat, SEL1 subfamily [Magnetospira sp. QH-2]